MLPHDISRCGGLLGNGAEQCPRKNDCARYLAPAGPNGSPFVMSACGAGVDAFVHVANVRADAPPAHPANTSSDGVLAMNTGDQQ